MYLNSNQNNKFSIHNINLYNIRTTRFDLIKHLNQSLTISSPFGRFRSYIKAFQDKYVEIKN